MSEIRSDERNSPVTDAGPDHVHDSDPRVPPVACWCGWHRPWTPDEAIAEAWKIADNDECDGVTWRASSDQWWRVTVSCLHGRYSGTSKGQIDVSTAFTSAVETFTRAHRSIVPPADLNQLAASIVKGVTSGI